MTDVWQAFLASFPAMGSYLVVLGVIAGFMLAERLIPAERNQPIRNQILSGECTFVYLFATPFVILLPLYLATAIANVTGGSLVSINLNEVGTGSQSADWLLHNIVFPFLPFVVFDFFYYWHHRFQHRLPVLWEQHKLHHMDESVCCLSGGRHHWLEDGIRVFTIGIPMGFLIALAPVQGALLVGVVAQWAIFIHANIRLPLGPLTPVFTGPQLHRIHHSLDVRHADKNYAAFFPIWDILFGTYYRPLPGEWPATGLQNRQTVSNLWEAAILPFRAWLPAIFFRARRMGSDLLRSLRD